MPVILCAEDDADLQHLISLVLEDDGYTILAASDGQFALEASRSHPGSVDLLLTDLDMPRMGGLELCTRIRTERPRIKILVMSGGLQKNDLALTDGSLFLPKPFTPSALRHSIQELLRPAGNALR